MKLIRTKDAVGHVLCHDITQIIKDVKKGAVFRKGHIVTEEDIPVLLSVGKEHLYVWEKDESMLHEDEAAQILYEICAGDSSLMHASEVKEGKIEVIVETDGLLKVDDNKLRAVNALGEMMIASRHGNFAVKKGDTIAGTRVIPLVIEKEKMARAKETAGAKPIFKILPFLKKKVGIVVTGSEVEKGLITDTFTPVLINKVTEFGAEVMGQVQTGDDTKREIAAIRKFLEDGADLILCSGGMSVDPDDRTPFAIKSAVQTVVTYGAPVLPGAMFMLAYAAYEGRKIPVCGLPGCVMYSKRTIFDLVLPRLMADEELTAEDVSILGQGGLCLNCKICTFPNCGFGKAC